MSNNNGVPAGLPPIPSMLRSNKEAGQAVTHETEQPTETPAVASGGQDPREEKKQKRLLACRQYSQKYRHKQAQYIAQLETEVKALQAEIAIKTPRIKYVDRQKSLLRAENGSINKKLSAYAGELDFKQAQYAELKKEKDNLKQLYVHQLQQMQQKNHNMNFPFGST